MKLEGLSNGELVSMAQEIENDPANKNTSGGLYLFTKTARAKLDQINRQITFNLGEARKARGETINQAGYSGRQTKRGRG